MENLDFVPDATLPDEVDPFHRALQPERPSVQLSHVIRVMHGQLAGFADQSRIDL